MRHPLLKAIIAALCLLLTGCFSLRITPLTKRTYTLTPSLSNIQNIQTPASLKGTLLVKELEMGAIYRNSAFVYRLDKSRYENDYYNGFVIPPRTIITEAIQEGLLKRGGFTTHDYPGPAQFRLSGKILALCGDYRPGRPPRAVLEIRIFMEKRENSRRWIIISKTYTQARQIPAKTPEHLIEGWNADLDALILDFLKDISALGT